VAWRDPGSREGRESTDEGREHRVQKLQDRADICFQLLKNNRKISRDLSAHEIRGLHPLNSRPSREIR
jgi:hypothetical protein